MREYELYLVIDAEAEEEQTEALVERLTQIVVAGDGTEVGEVIKVDARGKRRLAYPINNKRDSQDIILTINTSPQALSEIERVLKLNEQVLRYLVVRIGD